jgi:hypothetical protein
MRSRTASAVLIALTIAFFLPILRGATFSTVAGRQVSVYPWRAFDPVYPDYPQNDQADLNFPWQTFFTRSLRSGEFPLWNPDSFGGQPFFANGSSALLYPPKLVAAVLLSPGWAHDALSILHVLLAGIGMWFFLRELGYTGLPSLLGAAAWMFCPFNMAWLQLEVVAPAAAWLPIGCCLAHRAISRNSSRAAVGAAAAMACALVGGHLLFMALVYGVVVSYAAALTIGRAFRDPHGWRDPVLRLATIIAGPLLLGAVVLVPTVVYLRSLGRESLPYALAHEGIRLPYGVFWNLLRPPKASPVTELEMHQMAYVGRLVAVLALVGIFTQRHGTWLGRVLAVATFLIATDTLVLKWIYAVFPQFSFFSPLGRLLNFFDFGVILLGVAGLETLLQWTRRWPRLAAAGFAAALVIVSATAIELVVYARRVNPEFPLREDRFSFPRTPLIRRLSTELGTGHNGPGRMIPIRRTVVEAYSPPILSANEALVFGFESAAGWDSTLPNRAETLWRIVGGESVEAVLSATYRRAFWASFDVAGTRFDVLPQTGITTIVTAPEVADEPRWEQRREASALKLQSIYSGIDGHIYRILDADGGPVLVARPSFVSDSRAALDWLLNPQVDYRHQAVLETDDVPQPWRNHGSAASGGTARVVAKTANTEEIDVSATGDAWVVVPSNWDAGWSAEADGQAVPVVRANYTFQAVPVPAGTRRLRLTYRPRGLAAGAIVSLSAFLLVVARGVRRQTMREAATVAACAMAIASTACGRHQQSSDNSSIHVILATYGYNCRASPGNATASVTKKCERNLNCEYAVDVAQLGDPAPGCAKNFIVNYQCFDGARERRVVVDREAGGNVASLTCE